MKRIGLKLVALFEIVYGVFGLILVGGGLAPGVPAVLLLCRPALPGSPAAPAAHDETSPEEETGGSR